MLSNFAPLIPYLTLGSHAVLIFLLISIVFKDSWGKRVIDLAGKKAILLSFLVSIVAVGGSLFYSEIIGFAPCSLCWWQRIFIYPLVLIFGIAFFRKIPRAFAYSVPLVILSAVLSLYQSYVYMGGTSVLPCTALGGACAKNYVMEFGYISIPSMSLTISLYIIVLSWISRIYDKGSHA